MSNLPINIAKWITVSHTYRINSTKKTYFSDNKGKLVVLDYLKIAPRLLFCAAGIFFDLEEKGPRYGNQSILWNILIRGNEKITPKHFLICRLSQFINSVTVCIQAIKYHSVLVNWKTGLIVIKISNTTLWRDPSENTGFWFIH